LNLVHSIGLSEVSYSVGYKLYYIDFKFDKDNIETWKFLNKKERDETFENICDLSFHTEQK